MNKDRWENLEEVNEKRRCWHDGAIDLIDDAIDLINGLAAWIDN